ncbi:class D beta-lactamase [Hazenella coriacea]
MNTLIAVIFTILFVCQTGSIQAASGKADKELDVDELFKGIDGTMVIKDLDTDNLYIYNPDRSKQTFTPESTFKVPHSLIGLEEKAIIDEYEVKRWDGVIREFETWNRDHSLASAMRYSAIWFYQDMAKDIGNERMQHNLTKMNYGNKDISGGLDTFWLDSSLKISAQEQVEFLEQLVEEKLPYQEQNLKTVKRIMINDEQNEYTLYGKTGTRLSDLGLGWYVGFIKTKNKTWVFATNIDGSGTIAKNITIDCLKEMKIIPTEIK